MPLSSTLRDRERPMLTKVPTVGLLFWTAKILTTGMGETVSDFLVHRLPVEVAVLIGAVLFSIAIVRQLRADRYSAWTYWIAVAMVSVFGTMVADAVHIGLGVPYFSSTVVFSIALAVVFWRWQRSEGTLSIHSIHTARRERYYWTTVLVTFALGTAAGDMTATSLHLGYFSSGILFLAVIAAPAVAHTLLNANAIATFWIAYITTRPLGASFADWLAVSHKRGGEALGSGPISVSLIAVILGLVAYLAYSRSDTPHQGVRESLRLDPQ